MYQGAALRIAENRPTVARPESVRVARPHDEIALFDMLWNGLRINNDAVLPPERDIVLAQVRACCALQGAIAGVIEASDGRLIGSTGLRVCRPTWFSADWCISQLWLFVAPEFRRGKRYADDLFQFCLWHQADINANSGAQLGLECSVISRNKSLAAKERLWGRYAERVGALFWVDGSAS